MRRLRRILIVVVLGALALWFLLPDSGPSVEPGSILVLEIGGGYVEASEPSLLSRLFGDGRRSFVGLLSELRKAQRDDRLAAVVLRIRNLDVGWGKAEEIRSAVEELRAAGRQTLAYLEVESLGANLEYYVATAAEAVHAAPGARSGLVGLAAEYLFLGGMFEKLGVELEVERIGRYKTATDMLAGREMSEAHREMADALLDSINAQFIAGIAAGRNLTPEFVRDAIDHAPMTPQEMQGLGLIDGVAYYDELIDRLGGGPVILGSDYAEVDPATVGFEPVAQFALVYGTGLVVTGDGSSTRSGQPVLASDTVTAALKEAAEDDDIAAIIFRIDSPGGSALASDIVWRATQTARETGKPLIASFSDVAASGGYYVAAGADAIVASAGSITGSIGVYVLRPVLRGLLDKLGIGVEALTRGPHADLLLSSQPLTPATRGRLRTEIQSVYELFVERVADGRNLSTERVDQLGRGRVWTGVQAVESGLIDEVGGLRVAVGRAKASLGLDLDADVALITFPQPMSLAEQIDDLLRGIAASAGPELPLPRVARSILAWLESVPEGAPALVPPFIVEIR
ncbi:MAG: signal peptide peptidase SppA [Myxococcales bacterium]|nr:signal peptide peptidase SppA [Myxococcales bacterium]